MKEVSRVYLVGSGPSDASLLTLRAKELIESADVIIYDALVDSSIHRMFPTRAKLYNVGKRASAHAMRQEEINALIVSVALSQGGKIVRLKGGDPFVFGRGGEEMQALRDSGISYEIVPG
ncbi:MAG: uroporphyrin-III C-methyltransferase, partial [Alloprevotella sp.]|nr:uroporphyrin-III C-methyltransferase [Alloprevotella sp.]